MTDETLSPLADPPHITDEIAPIPLEETWSDEDLINLALAFNGRSSVLKMEPERPDTIIIQLDGKTVAHVNADLVPGLIAPPGSEQTKKKSHKSKRITIVEIFGPTIQGEGLLAGKPTVFVRTGGCDFGCSWCDSLHAVLPEYKGSWRMEYAKDVFAEIQKLSPLPIIVTLSGGNPALHDGLEELIDLGHAEGYQFAIETQGSVPKEWFNKLDYLTLSPKPPSSDMATNWQKLDACVKSRARSILKVVVFDDLDYLYAQEVSMRYPYIPMYLQPGNANTPEVAAFDRQAVLDKYEWLINKVIADQWNEVTVLPQIHTLLWGNRQGV